MMNNLYSTTKLIRKSVDLVLLGIRNDYYFFEKLIMDANQDAITPIDHEEDCLNWLKAVNPTNIPDAIICDYNFISKDEFRLLRLIRAKEEFNNTPIIAVRSKEETVNAKLALTYGLDDCFEKPINWGALKERINFIKWSKHHIKLPSNTVESEYNVKISPLKRAFDILFAGGIILCISPILLLIAIAIKLESKGPVIYSSNRVGQGYHIFKFYKFRSMYKDADKRLKELQHLNQYDADSEDAAFVKIKNDPRITRVGRLIRKTSIDELPQLFNVLKGDMSVVGNRPLPMYEAELLTRDDWAERFMGPAGLTGLWQVTKRGKDDMSTSERVDLDITYAKNYSFMYDMNILMKTLPAMIQEENV